MAHRINYFTTRLYDIVLYPFGFLGDFWEIFFLSVVTSFVVLLAYKYFSSPKKIKEAKDRIKANIFAIRLYKDFWRVILGSFGKSLYYTLKYFSLNIATIVIILPILIPMFVQMDVRYGMRPFQEGEEFVITGVFDENPFDLDVKLQENEHFKPVMSPFFVNAYKDAEKKVPLKEAIWKVKAKADGDATIRIKVKDRVFEKRLFIGKYEGALSNKKYRDSSWGHFIYPVEKLMKEKSELKSIYINYPGREVSFLGFSTHWLVYYLLWTLIIVLAFKRRFGIEF